VIVDVAPLGTAGPDHLSFLDNVKYVPLLASTRAGAAFIHPEKAAHAPAGTIVLLTRHPYRAYAIAAQAFYPDPPPVPGIAPSAVVDATAMLGPGCAVEPNAVIGPRAQLGRNCLVGPNAVIGPGCVIGNDVRIGANASLSHCLIGDRVRIYPGARIGQDGFGFAPDAVAPVKVPQLGRVVIGDDVEVGANTTIDRGAGPDTVIGSGTMIDNLVQIGHNVEIGRCSVLVAQCGISGSTRFGNYVMIGGQSGFAGHLSIGNGARIGAQSGIMRDVAAGESVIGTPGVPARDFHRQVVALRRLAAKKGD
jgi:UDP-3-O-[3-hydroxymyristoyl] glucosamine N-acyltransferase